MPWTDASSYGPHTAAVKDFLAQVRSLSDLDWRRVRQVRVVHDIHTRVLDRSRPADAKLRAVWEDARKQARVLAADSASTYVSSAEAHLLAGLAEDAAAAIVSKSLLSARSFATLYRPFRDVIDSDSLGYPIQDELLGQVVGEPAGDQVSHTQTPQERHRPPVEHDVGANPISAAPRSPKAGSTHTNPRQRRLERLHAWGLTESGWEDLLTYLRIGLVIVAAESCVLLGLLANALQNQAVAAQRSLSFPDAFMIELFSGDSIRTLAVQAAWTLIPVALIVGLWVGRAALVNRASSAQRLSRQYNYEERRRWTRIAYLAAGVGAIAGVALLDWDSLISISDPHIAVTSFIESMGETGLVAAYWSAGVAYAVGVHASPRIVRRIITARVSALGVVGLVLAAAGWVSYGLSDTQTVVDAIEPHCTTLAGDWNVTEYGPRGTATCVEYAVTGRFGEIGPARGRILCRVGPEVIRYTSAEPPTIAGNLCSFLEYLRNSP